uniref:SnoaL-like domain-containing protein n=1 Tax=Dunaliella tertiolecta TaxID=3047 RepID=A0A7S3VQV0_DUNTE|mmetsp:Transcript_23513/g.64834  ORF Transcript_23513/g.64834 Transcript_23513/m.64834 type:complete len:460 (+) Transcript_23513:77-1456(+)
MLLRASTQNVPVFGGARQKRPASVVSPSWLKLVQSGRNARGSVVSQAAQAETLFAKDTIIKFYTAYNAGDIDTIASVMAEDVVYHDMIFEEPFRGRDEVVAYMRKVRDEVPGDLKFVMEDIAGEERKAGITWHVEIGEGIQFPFSRGCSFYTTNEKGQILTARDLVESPSKPGSASLGVLTAVAPLIRALGPKADPSNLKRLPIAAAAVWALYAGYNSYIMLGTSAPGLPAWQTPPEVLQEVFHESLNFFYVNIGLNAAGLSLIPDFPENPVSEALFNFIAAWGVLFLPVILTEKKSAKVQNKWGWWTAIMFVTNVFFIPFLALRAAPEPETASGSGTSSNQQVSYPGWTKGCALVGLTVGLFSVGWAFLGRPELAGDLADRWSFFQQEVSGNRVFYAFVIDAALYSVWQAVLLGSVPSATASHRFIPFLGLAAHLLQAKSTPEQSTSNRSNSSSTSTS